MRCISPRRKDISGFTLVEVLIIAPIIILLITGFIALIITITGDVLRTKGTNDLIYNTQTALSRIDQDVQRTVEFRQTSYTPTSPQGQADDATAFDTISQGSTYLVLRTLATNKSLVAEDRQLVYKTISGTCSTTPYTIDVVYFTKVISGVTSLWRRVVHGNTTDAGTPCAGTSTWQVPTCAPGYTNTTVCKADDSLVLENISSLSFQYLNAAGNQINTTTPAAGTAIKNPYDAAGTTKASSVKVSLSVSGNVAGRESSYAGSLQAAKAPTLSPVGAPGPLTLVINGNPGSNPVVSWNVPTGNQPITYTVRYGTGGNPSTIMSGCENISTTQCTLTGLTLMVYYDISVTATNTVGSSVATGIARRTPPS